MIGSFRGPYRWLSNFHEALVVYCGVEWPTNEHAYQAAKQISDDNFRRILLLTKPSEAMREGRKVFLRPNWETEKLCVMYAVNKDKFSRHPDLRARLEGTGDSYLMEGNTWGDKFWGVCDGMGENNLGKILMRIRAENRLEDRGLSFGKMDSFV